jgi:hypothetical protein
LITRRKLRAIGAEGYGINCIFVAAERFQQVAIFRLVEKHAIPNRGNYLGPICSTPQLVADADYATGNHKPGEIAISFTGVFTPSFSGT